MTPVTPALESRSSGLFLTLSSLISTAERFVLKRDWKVPAMHSLLLGVIKVCSSEPRWEREEKESDVKAKARLTAIFNHSGARPEAKRVASALRVSSDVHGSGAPAAGRGRLVFAFATSVSLIAILAILLTSVAPAGASEGCPNEARREEQGAAGRALPDCRAYELVSPRTCPAPSTPTTSTAWRPWVTPASRPPGVPAAGAHGESSVSIADNGNAALFGSGEPNSQQDG